MSSKEVRLIDANALIAELTKGTIIPDDIYLEGIMSGLYNAIKTVQKMPTIDSESLKSNKRMIPLDEVYRVIAGHSDYNGDAILAALTCIAEGKDVKPVKPLENLRPHGKWEKHYHSYFGLHQCVCSKCKEDEYWRKFYCYGCEKFCPNCGARMEVDNV